MSTIEINKAFIWFTGCYLALTLNIYSCIYKLDCWQEKPLGNMPGKHQKVFSKPITSYLDSYKEGEGSKVDEEEALDPATPVTLQAISYTVAQAVGQIGSEFQQMKDEVNKSLGALETRFDSKLTTVVHKNDTIEAAQRDLNRRVELVKAQTAD